MAELDTIERTLIETEQRSKSNSHRIDSLEKDIDAIRSDQKAIYEIATSVQVIAERVTHIEEKVDETGVKLDAQAEAWRETEKKLSAEITEAKQKPEHEIASNVSHIRLAIITAICTAIATGLLGAFLHFIN